MVIEHIAIWVSDLERMKNFYIKYFNMTSNQKYFNPKKNFSSYFLSFETGKMRIELMHRPEIKPKTEQATCLGWAHIAISVGSKHKVNQLTEQLRSDGYSIEGEPRVTGDGYYESVILDPEGNQVEITI